MGSERNELAGKWALILGTSSGFGEATSVELGRHGMNIFGVHMDRKSALPHVEQVIERIKGFGSKVLFFNVNAADEEKRKETLSRIKETLRGDPSPHIHVLLHSLAFGTLKPYVGNSSEESLTKAQMEMTLDVMAHSLVYWVQDLVSENLLTSGSRVFAMTSAGSTRVIPAYGAVSAAKAALEAHIRQLAVELGLRGVRVNAVRAGVTDTPALRKIPGNERLIEQARAKNPSGRSTEPEDVARAIAVLSLPATQWMSGDVIGVDGGEDIVA
jgi:enoyl-[acyl-carrier-protein] reductase (NADH)